MPRSRSLKPGRPAHDDAEFAEFEAAFAEFAAARNLRKGAPKKRTRDLFILRRADEAHDRDGAPLSHDDKRSAVGARRRTKAAEAAKRLLDALAGTRARPGKLAVRPEFRRNAFVIVAEELNRMRAADIKYLTEFMDAADEEGKADAIALIRKIEREGDVTPNAVKVAYHRQVKRLAEAEKCRLAEVARRVARAKKLLLIRAGVEPR